MMNPRAWFVVACVVVAWIAFGKARAADTPTLEQKLEQVDRNARHMTEQLDTILRNLDELNRLLDAIEQQQLQQPKPIEPEALRK